LGVTKNEVFLLVVHLQHKRICMMEQITEILNPREETFCLEYMLCGNASQAMKAAGYSDKSARAAGSRMLAQPQIRNRLKEMRANVAETVGVTAAMVANELKRIAFSNIGDVQDSLMSLKDFKALPASAKAAVAELRYEQKVVKGELVDVVKVKMHNKIKALVTLSTMMGFAQHQEPIVIKSMPKVVVIGNPHLNDPYNENSGYRKDSPHYRENPNDEIPNSKGGNPNAEGNSNEEIPKSNEGNFNAEGNFNSEIPNSSLPADKHGEATPSGGNDATPKPPGAAPQPNSANATQPQPQSQSPAPPKYNPIFIPPSRNKYT
jgi:phage terminase small subunit